MDTDSDSSLNYEDDLSTNSDSEHDLDPKKRKLKVTRLKPRCLFF